MLEKFSKEYIAYLEKFKLLPLAETAKILNMHKNTLRSLARLNQIQHVRIGKKYYFNLETIQNQKIEKTELPNGIMMSNGFLRVRVGSDFEGADLNGYVALHRLVMQAHTLRRIGKDEIVHPIDGNSLNFTVKNLEVLKNLEEHTKKYNSMPEGKDAES